MKRLCIVLITLFISTAVVQATEVEGLIVKKSQFSVSETITRLENALTKKGITIALRWNHAAKAEAVDIPLRPTELLIFGNPKLGSNLFTSQQTAGIDLPMKALAWEDKNGDVWLGYNDPNYIAHRHGIKDRPEVVKKMSGALNKMSNIAIGAE
ncbi:MAG: DUF302 domain-containing protein [Thiohalomonadales bacterium]|nr:DUF302 domain-containing protein [Thiohalomonadales bacterium]